MSNRILGYREQQVLQLVASDLAGAGRVRSYRAIAEALGMSQRSHVCDVMGRLERRGLLIRIGAGPQWRIRLAGTPDGIGETVSSEHGGQA